MLFDWCMFFCIRIVLYMVCMIKLVGIKSKDVLVFIEEGLELSLLVWCKVELVKLIGGLDDDLDLVILLIGYILRFLLVFVNVFNVVFLYRVMSFVVGLRELC